MMSKDSKKL